jgi:2-polyprenyl-3-methyl-5-hydroxy-6-metoxy-1,4-benzoquinol methylase
VVAVDRTPPPEGLDPAIEWREADIKSLDLASLGEFDGILCRNVIQFLPDDFALQTLLPALVARLRPGGFIAIETFFEAPDPDMPLLRSLFTADEVARALAPLEIVSADQYRATAPDMKGLVRKFAIADVLARKPAA